MRLQSEPSVSLRSEQSASEAERRAEAERRRRAEEALAAARDLRVPAPSPIAPAAPGRPGQAAAASPPPAAAARPTGSTWQPPLAGGARPGLDALRDPSRWRTGPVAGGPVRQALRNRFGCNHADFAAMTLAEREACQERESRVAEANARNVGPVSTARYIQRGMQDRDCRRARHSTDHASTFTNGAGTQAERTRGGVNTVPGCGVVLRNLDRIGAALRGRDHVD